MDFTALYQSIGLCIVSVLIEAVGSTKSGKIWFESLKKPSYSLPFSVWYIIGALYYVMCGIIAYRIFTSPDEYFWIKITALGLMMLANGLSNFLLFRLKSLSWFYFSLFPFTIILLFLYILLLQTDTTSSRVLLPYLAWLIYDFYYIHALWKTNKLNS